jgi:hypothetical protein
MDRLWRPARSEIRDYGDRDYGDSALISCDLPGAPDPNLAQPFAQAYAITVTVH